MRLVYLSPVPWASFHQRPHKFVKWFYTRHGGEVLWIDPYPTRLPLLGDFQRLKFANVERPTLSAEMPRWLQLVRPRALPIEPLPWSGILNRFLWRDVLFKVDQFLTEPNGWIGIGKPSELALQVLSRVQGISTFYDAMDNFPAFYEGLSRHAMEQRQTSLALQVSKILVSSTGLARRFDNQKQKVFMSLNACDMGILPDRKLLLPCMAQSILGYMGTMGHWFDWPLVIALANAVPTMQVRLIGPVYYPSPVKLPPNIELLPACDHDTALLAMQGFTVGLIPFRQTELTASVDPIKYYEYRALGLPVISTSFGEMALRGKQNGVFLVNDRSNLARVIEDALAYESNKDEIRQFRHENSWEVRFESCRLFD